ncbi:hypothetical protein Nepgr_025665 [Nepenthes gracilis]|uniref:Uncharacterized protein n=1 Tax=Nepenthes gracilis TaxID=150966 RepID=A0AAD3T883_NEPGR|nr:hypothetical protein Nepgr_025665 [Nepenthes gracilis]
MKVKGLIRTPTSSDEELVCGFSELRVGNRTTQFTKRVGKIVGDANHCLLLWLPLVFRERESSKIEIQGF